MKNRFMGVVLFCAVTAAALPASALWVITGGEVWAKRTGPGITLALGGNTCTDDYCDSDIDVKLIGSFGSTLGFYYRLMPNLGLYADFHVGYVNTNYNGGVDVIKDDKGFIFQTTFGAAFHAPITGWLDAYVGLGLGYALLRFKANYDDRWDMVLSLRGFNTELKIGADVYPISSAPTFGVGPIFRLGFTAWPKACVKQDDEDFVCRGTDEHDDLDGFDRLDNTPFLIFVGLQARYGF
jgi:hypothetical protein